MLGKTNLTTVKEGTIASDITEYKFADAEVSGVDGTFIKAVYAGNVLVGITYEGAIAYSFDGENWSMVRLNLEKYYNLYDIMWDGNKYVVVGAVSAEGNEGKNVEHGIIATTEDFAEFTVIEDNENYYSRYYSVIKRNGRYILIGLRESSPSGLNIKKNIFSKVGELNSWESETVLYDLGSNNSDMEYTHINVKNNSNCILVLCRYNRTLNNNTVRTFEVMTSTDGIEYNRIEILHPDNKPYDKQMSLTFVSKDSLYYGFNHADFNYKLIKLINLNETAVISTEKNFSFVDAVYFNKYEIFINNHQMLILAAGEQISNKTLDDLTDITYDFSMTAIIKAFDKLYIFGTGGHILVSTDEINNEEALAVKSLSAYKALYEAKNYTDAKCAELEARIVSLESSIASE